MQYRDTASVDHSFSLDTVVEELEALEQAFQSTNHSARKVIFSDPSAVERLYSVLQRVGDKACPRFNYYVGEDSMRGLDLLWLGALVQRFDSIMVNILEAGGFLPWLLETDGVEIWWMLRHGVPSLGKIRNYRTAPLPRRLVSLLEGNEQDALAAMKRLANSNLFYENKALLESLAGTLVSIAIDQSQIAKELSTDKRFVHALMESFQQGDNPATLFAKLAMLCRPNSRKEKRQERVSLRSKPHHLEASIDLLANALAV